MPKRYVARVILFEKLCTLFSGVAVPLAMARTLGSVNDGQLDKGGEFMADVFDLLMDEYDASE